MQSVSRGFSLAAWETVPPIGTTGSGDHFHTVSGPRGWTAAAEPELSAYPPLRTTLMAQTPWEAKNAEVEFAQIQQAPVRLKPALANLVEFYRQQGPFAPKELDPRAERNRLIRVAGYSSEKLDWQIKDIAPQAWESMQRTTQAET